MKTIMLFTSMILILAVSAFAETAPEIEWKKLLVVLIEIRLILSNRPLIKVIF